MDVLLSFSPAEPWAAVPLLIVSRQQRTTCSRVSSRSLHLHIIHLVLGLGLGYSHVVRAGRRIGLRRLGGVGQRRLGVQSTASLY